MVVQGVLHMVLVAEAEVIMQLALPVPLAEELAELAHLFQSLGHQLLTQVAEVEAVTLLAVVLQLEDLEVPVVEEQVVKMQAQPQVER
tara:strand:+ start:429 stop:692 length:264 start_codon:yes stop_codon:yes gene_type:complete